MSRCRLILPMALSVSLIAPFSAGAFSNKNAKQSPGERVSQLILTVKTDKDEDKRAEAAHELRDCDPAKHPELVPILIDVIQNDPKPGVRAEAIATVAKFRPVSQEVGMSLEQATKDSSFRVRWQARSSLMSYRLAGYRSGPRADENMVMPQETQSQNRLRNPFGRRSSNPSNGELTTMPPPEPTPSKPWTQWFSFGKRSSNQTQPSNMVVPSTGETAPPPLAQPDGYYSAQPRMSTRPQLVPSDSFKLQKPPAQAQPQAPPSDAGPDLPPS